MAYYGTGTKEAILASLDTAINTVAGIEFVDYQRIWEDGIDYDKCPGVFINDVRTDKKPLLKDIIRNDFSIGLVLIVYVEDDEDLSTKMNEFMELVKAPIMDDPYRKHEGEFNAYSTFIAAVATDQGSHHPQGVSVMYLDVRFYSLE